MFTSDEIKSFQDLWQKQFGQEISREFALEQATALVSLVKNTYKPMTKKEYEKYKIKN